MHQGISFVARLGLENAHLAKGETFGSNIVKDDEPMIDRRTYRAGNERWLSRDALCASGSKAKGRPCRISSIRVFPLPPIF